MSMQLFLALARRTASSIGLALLIAAPALADSPKQDAYDEDAFCLGTTEAAAALPDSFVKQKSEADTMRKLYAKRLPNSAQAFGKTVAQAMADADHYRRASIADLHKPDPKLAAAEQADLAKSVQLCATLPVFELIGHAKS